MKTIKLTDDQFETLFHFVDERVEDIVDRSVQFQIQKSQKIGKIYLMFILFWKKQIIEPLKLYLLVTDYYYAKHTY